MFNRAVRALWGDLTVDEIKRFGILALTLLCIIGPYWLLRTLKDAFFDKWVDLSYQPSAKMLSLVVIIPLVLLYSKLSDIVSKHNLIYLIATFYAAIFLTLAYFSMYPLAEMHNFIADKIPGRFIGWFAYIAIESFGSIVVALFWSFVASTTTTASAKRGYAMIIAGAQFGAIGGSYLTTRAPYFETVFGLGRAFPVLLMIASGTLLMVPLLIKGFMAAGHGEVEGQEKQEAKKPKTGLFEGLRLLTTKPYLLGVFVVATIYEVVGTIMDLQMKLLAKAAYGPGPELAGFMGWFGIAGNLVPLILALFGTSYIIRHFGIRFCLIAFPTAVAIAVIYVKFNASLWPAFAAMVVIKGLTYALNNPVKEMLYIPTSKDVKFKAKGWIDGFGGRLAKAGGSAINTNFANSLTDLMFYGSFISLGIIGFWVLVAMALGTSYNKLIKDEKIIE